MYYNNNNNGFNGGYQQPIQQQYGQPQMQQPVYGQANNAEFVLEQLRRLIMMGENMTLSSEDIRAEIRKMAATGIINIVGEGTNRIAVELNVPINHLLTFNTPAIIKIPYSISKGIDDNLRELLLIQKLRSLYASTGDWMLKLLIDTLPSVSEVKGFPLLIAQEKIISIDKSPEIVAQAQGNPNALATLCIATLIDKYGDQQKQLLEALDKYTIFADLNPITAPFQYGFKNVNGVSKLTILDTGYVVPKFLEYHKLINDGTIIPRHYFIMGREAIMKRIQNEGYNYVLSPVDGITTTSALNIVQPILYGQSGIYVSNNPKEDPSTMYVNDMRYFVDCYSKLRRLANSNPTSELGTYFASLRSKKSSSGYSL